MGTRLIIDGNAVYEIDEDCQACRAGQKNERLIQESCGCHKKKTEKRAAAGRNKR